MMPAPVSRIVEALRTIERTVTPKGLVKAGAVGREPEGRFLLDMVTDARELIEQNQRKLEA
jgi:hypothetical protein